MGKIHDAVATRQRLIDEFAMGVQMRPFELFLIRCRICRRSSDSQQRRKRQCGVNPISDFVHAGHYFFSSDTVAAAVTGQSSVRNGKAGNPEPLYTVHSGKFKNA